MIIDNFALENFICPAKFDLRIRQGYVPIRRKAALGFGGVIHYGLAEWYRTTDAKRALARIVEMWPASMPVEDFRNMDKATAIMAEYIQTYPKENWKILGETDGRPLIERAFTLDTDMFLQCHKCDLGLYASNDDYLEGRCSNCGEDLEPLQYGGIIDLGVSFSDRIYVVDHKTTTRMGESYFLQFKPDNQMTGYIWAASKLTDQAVGGAIINAIGVYKSKDTVFDRKPTTRTPVEIQRWLEGVLWQANEIKRCEANNYWPLITKHCTMYGLCEFHNVHVLANEAEWAKRLEQDYVKSKWDHEHRDEDAE